MHPRLRDPGKLPPAEDTLSCIGNHHVSVKQQLPINRWLKVALSDTFDQRSHYRHTLRTSQYALSSPESYLTQMATWIEPNPKDST
jgi:hypothetical protein